MTVILYILGFLLAICIIIGITVCYLSISAISDKKSEYYPVWKEALKKVKKAEYVKIDNNSFKINKTYQLKLNDEDFSCDLYFGEKCIAEDFEMYKISNKIYNIIRKSYPDEFDDINRFGA